MGQGPKMGSRSFIWQMLSSSVTYGELYTFILNHDLCKEEEEDREEDIRTEHTHSKCDLWYLSPSHLFILTAEASGIC